MYVCLAVPKSKCVKIKEKHQKREDKGRRKIFGWDPNFGSDQALPLPPGWCFPSLARNPQLMGYWLSQIIPSQDNPKTMHLWTVQLKWTLKVTSWGYYTLIYHSESAPLCCGSKTQRFQAHLLKIWPQDSLIENCQIFSIKESLKPTSMDFLQESLVWSSLEPTLLLRLFHSTNTYQVPTVCQALILQL